LTPSGNRLLFDTPPLLHSAKADRLDVLGDLISGLDAVTTRAVVDEVGSKHAEARAAVLNASWISVVNTDSLELLKAFGAWSERLGATHGYNVGETTLCAYAEVNGGTLVLDDLAARRVAERHGLAVRGTVGLIADACRRGRRTVTNASVLVDDLRATGMRLPFPRGGFESWAREKRLLG